MDKLRRNNSSNIVPQVWFKLEVTVRVEQEVLRKPSPVVSKAFVELYHKNRQSSSSRTWRKNAKITHRILTQRTTPLPNTIPEVIKLAFILALRLFSLSSSIKLMPFHPNQVVSFGITRGLQDVPGLQKDSAHVGVEFGEPLPQFGVPTPVVDENVDRIDDERE